MSRCGDGIAASRRLAVNGILGQTSVLVRHAQNGDWNEVEAAARRRRTLLAMLESQRCVGDDPAIDALREAVAESERALDAIRPLPMARAS